MEEVQYMESSEVGKWIAASIKLISNYAYNWDNW
jgi:hypothetical protein